ncbi:MAG: aromatic amino acid lyase, partial [Bacteroidota bacterium]
WYKGEKLPAEEALATLQWAPLELGSKEGLALLNGTQFMSAFGVLSVLRGLRLLEQADFIAAASLDAFDARPEPFDPLIHQVRHQPGQAQTAARIRTYLAESEIAVRPKPHVQDPYSFRCIPQVHGATRDVIGRAVTVFINEVNSATDNPTIFPDADRIISAGNFHGQPLAVALDGLAIALAELGSISERRTYKLISGQRGLPAFLIASPGLHSGLMIPQYTAASLVSQNKQLCVPASVDTIDSSNGQEDHVSMGANAATRTLRVIRNLETILAIEWLNATQALQFRQPLASSPQITALITAYRDVVPFVEADRPLYRDIAASVEFLQAQMNPGSFPSVA